MRFETFVALRYLRGKRKNRFVSLITLISVAGVSVGVIALIVVISVMTGFDNALRATVIGNRAHLTLTDPHGRDIEDVPGFMEKVKAAAPEVKAMGPIMQVEALLKTDSRHSNAATGAYVIGVDPTLESDVTQLADNLTSKDGRQFGYGRLPEDKEIVLGYRLAQRLGVNLGSEVAVVTARSGNTFIGPQAGKTVWLTVSGISQAKMSDFDLLYAFVNIPTAKMLTGNRGVDAVHCKLDDPFMADAVGLKLESALGCRTETWYQNQREFFDALKQEKLAMFIILVFIILVAAFNITSTLIMVVMEKRRDIGILKTLGTSTFSILRLFIIEGLLIGLSGTFFGVVCGTLLAYNINPVAEFIAGLFGIDLFNSQIYYFDRIPVAVVGSDVFWITLCAVVLTFVSTLYPAYSAARLNPVDALRHE